MSSPTLSWPKTTGNDITPLGYDALIWKMSPPDAVV